MAVQRTFSIIKPDATARNITGKVNAKIEEAGLRIIAQKRLQLTKEQAGGFYAVHKERPFYNDLVAFMMSGPVVVQVLEGENAIAKYREVMGATNPADADAGTIRAEFAQSIDANTVHGSDAPETAAEEIPFFFSDDEIVGQSVIEKLKRPGKRPGFFVSGIQAVYESIRIISFTIVSPIFSKASSKAEVSSAVMKFSSLFAQYCSSPAAILEFFTASS